jgi:hypothetical protein
LVSWDKAGGEGLQMLGNDLGYGKVADMQTEREELVSV